MFPLLFFPFLLPKCFRSFPFLFSPSEMFPLFSFIPFSISPALNFYISPYYITNIPSPVLLLIIPSPGTLTLTFCILIITLLRAQLRIRPSLSFPHGPTLTHASNHPALRRVCNQIGMTQGRREGLYRTYKALVPSHLLLRHRKPMLMKLEVGPPQLVGLVSDFDALVWNGHLWTCGGDHQLLILVGSRCTQMHTASLATATGGTRITACGLIAQEPYKGSSKNKINKSKKQLTSLGTIRADMQHLFNSRSRRLCKSRPCSIRLPPLPGALPRLPTFLLLLCLVTLLIIRRPSTSGLTLAHEIGDGFAI